ncbi:hypothetical protein PanWU01x14_326920 [Parasponia andersonii]|uniref:Uncharacterized protein n=1 Tax=Parasponia andersonii TaxID=3476 RepID=A0A2P5AJA9_PARAD|nr:hypothetical protein PanWU01x14_326920 [Parasponia andersonii]
MILCWLNIYKWRLFLLSELLRGGGGLLGVVRYPYSQLKASHPGTLRSVLLVVFRMKVLHQNA